MAENASDKRAATPIKVGQKIFREWCGSHQAVMDPLMAADLVKRIGAAIVAERANRPADHGKD